jgi:hypothetical protein
MSTRYMGKSRGVERGKNEMDVEGQGDGLSHLFDFDFGDMWVPQKTKSKRRYNIKNFTGEATGYGPGLRSRSTW